VIEAMKVDPAEIEMTLKLLAATPRDLASISKGLDHTRLHRSSDEEPWSANDILAHLRACADVWGKSIMAMIAQDHPTLRYVSPRTWIKKTNYLEQEFGVSLEAFTKQRSDLLEVLNSLKPEGWSRGATFTETTKGREQTVLSYAQRLARHESEHCIQVANLLQKRRNK
jgi:hypothetical protein